MDSIREIVLDIFRQFGHDRELSDGDSLVQLGMLDSLNILELINALEQRIQISFDEDDLTLGNFQSIEAIVQVVSRKLKR